MIMCVNKPIQIFNKGNKIAIKYFINNDFSEKPSELGYWTPPRQASSSYDRYSYEELISEYDKLMTSSNGYIRKYRYEKNGKPILTKDGGYELFHYVLEPTNYSKTIYIQAGTHGNEMDAKQQLLRVVDILVNKINEVGYERFRDIRSDCRLVIVPCVSPYGHYTKGMNIPYIYNSTEYAINPNRNFDFNQQWYLPSAGVGGYPSFDIEETQHVRDVLENIGYENIDYAMDWHDGGGVTQHYWINYALDSKSRTPINNFVKYLIEKYDIKNPVIDNCKDTSTAGTASMYCAKTLGITGSTVEWIGGYLGYNFDESQMTQSMEIRGNMLLMAYENDFKGWKIEENKDAKYFKFDYPKSFTREGLRYDGADSRTIVTDQQIYARWDKLQSKYPNLISKSDKLGSNAGGTQDIFTYTFGKGLKKVLYVGGIKRYGASCKIDEFAIYQLIEYLCNDYIVGQSKFLQELKNNYTIIVLPCIDNKAGNNTVQDRNSGLNNMALSYKKWQIVDGKCQPTSYALSVHDIPILKSIIDNNSDLKCIVSGGEDLTKYGANSSEYSTEFETHIVIPKNQNNDIDSYKSYLEVDKNENVVIENTVGTTFGDYAFDNYNIPTYFVQLKPSKRYEELSDYHTLSEVEYMHSNYEAGRRMANIVNLFLK